MPHAYATLNLSYPSHMKDQADRRLRWDAPEPHRTKFEPTQLHLNVLSALSRHGKLSTGYLGLFSGRSDESDHKRNLTDLYHGYCEDAEHTWNDLGFPFDEKGEKLWKHECKPKTFITRDPAQYLNREARYQPVVYELTDLGRSYLLPSPKLRRSKSFVHELYCGAFTASVARSAPFVFRDVLAAHLKDEKSPFYYPAGDEDVVPDDLFGIEYGPGKRKIFALEIDRATERIDTEITKNSSIAKKVAQYAQVMHDRTYERFGKNINALFSTTNDPHADSIIRYVDANVDHRFKHRFWAKAIYKKAPVGAKRTWDINFSLKEWCIPRELLPVLDGWRSTQGLQEIYKKPPAQREAP